MSSGLGSTDVETAKGGREGLPFFGLPSQDFCADLGSRARKVERDSFKGRVMVKGFSVRLTPSPGSVSSSGTGQGWMVMVTRASSSVVPKGGVGTFTCRALVVERSIEGGGVGGNEGGEGREGEDDII